MATFEKSGWGNLPIGGGTSPTGGAPTGGAPAKPALDTKILNGYVFQFIPDPLGLSDGRWENVGLDHSGDGGGAGRNDALSAAQAALSGFLQAQSLADARKMAAMENFQSLSKFALPAGAQFAPGYEPGGLANTLAARQGMKSYTPPAITPRTVNPGDVAGEIPPEIRQMLGAIRSAGGAG